MAPGASLVGLNVFGTFEDTTESNFLQAINYAVETDHVNVINESFGSNPFPDITALDATKQFDDAAVAAGVVVTRLQRRRRLDQHHRLAGDRPERHLGRRLDGLPVLRPDQLRRGALLRHHRLAERQHQLAELRRVRRDRRHGQPGRARRPELRLLRRRTRLTPSAPTSSASRPTSRRAAAPASRRRSSPAPRPWSSRPTGRPTAGATPTPALVKQILVSTATDLGAPAAEQGAGLLNSYKAVSWPSRSTPPPARPSPVGDTLLKSSQPAERRRRPGHAARAGRSRSPTPARHRSWCRSSGRTFGPDQNVQTGTVTLNDATSPQFANYQGLQNNYGVFHFKVPAGPGPAGRLDRLPGQPGQRQQRPGPADPDRPARPVRRALAAAGRGQLRQRGRPLPGRGHLDRRHLRRRGRRSAAPTGPSRGGWRPQQFVSFGSVSPSASWSGARARAGP